MTDIDPRQSPESPSASSQAGDPLASLHHMSMTAGLGSTEYVAINVPSVVALLLGIASVAVLLGDVMLLVPLAGLVCGIVAVRQIHNSNGTQSGRGLAWAGIVLSLAFAGLWTTLTVRDYLARQRARTEIGQLVDRFSDAVKASKWDEAWSLFSPEFKLRIKDNQATFRAAIQRIQAIQTGSTTRPVLKLTQIKAGTVQFSPTGEAGGPLLLSFEDDPAPKPLGAQYRRGEGAAGWQLDDLPALFQPPREGGGDPGQQ